MSEYMCWRKNRVSDSRVMWAGSAKTAAIEFAHMQRIEGCIVVCDEGGDCALFEVVDGDACSATHPAIDAARELEKVAVRDALQTTIERTFVQGVTAGIKTALREVEAHQGESVLTLRMKIRALLEPRT